MGGFKGRKNVALTITVYIALFEAIMNFKGKDCVTCLDNLAGTNECADDFFKQKAECLCCSLVIVHTEHGQWQTSFTWENSA